MPRNSSGTYSLPAGNPVVTGTLIETNWANPTMSDIGSSITDSLDRFGRGGMLAQLKLADGTLAAPAFAFNSEASTGLYRPAAATLNVSVLGSLVASFTNTAITFAKATTFSAGVTFSGTVTMAAVLAFFGGTAALPGLAVAGDLDTGIYSTTANTLGFSTAGVSRLVVDPSGNVGIAGTPALPLDVFTTTVGDKLRVRNTASSFETKLGISADSGYIDSGNTALALRVNGTERVRADLSGRVGIGRTPTTNLLEVAGTVNAILPNSAVDVGFAADITSISAAKFGTNNSGGANVYGAPNGSTYLAEFTSRPIVFTTNATERVRIGPAGEVGIGQAALVGSNRLLEVGNTLRTTTFVRINGAAASSSWIELFAVGVGTLFAGINTSGGALNGLPNNSVGIAGQNLPLVFSTGGIESGRFDTSGNFGIGVTPTYKLDILSPVSGAKLFRATASGAATLFGFADSGGSGITNADPQSGGALVYLAGQTVQLFTAGAERARVDATGNFFPAVTAAQNLGAPANVWSIIYGAHLQAPAAAGLLLNAPNATGQITLRTSGADRIVVTSDGRLYGTALHNNAGAITGTTNQYVASGAVGLTWTPGTNVASLTGISVTRFIRVGNVVSVSGTITVTPTAGAANTQFTATFPVASTTTGINGAVAGTIVGRDGGTNTITSGRITGDPTNPLALFIMTPPTNVAFICSWQFQYEVL